jgi:hypothetical protein
VTVLSTECAGGGVGDDSQESKLLSVRLEVVNGADRALRIETAKLALKAQKGARLHWTPDGVLLDVPAHGSKVAKVKFSHDSQCDDEFTLDFDGSVLLGTQPLTLSALTFVP